ncbi:MAG: DUF1020 domain-containing protein, partial [Proteobacteria bacterium]
MVLCVTAWAQFDLATNPFIQNELSRGHWEPGGKYFPANFQNRGAIVQRGGSVGVVSGPPIRVGNIVIQNATLGGSYSYTIDLGAPHGFNAHSSFSFTNSATGSSQNQTSTSEVKLNLAWQGLMDHPELAFDPDPSHPEGTGAVDDFIFDIVGAATGQFFSPQRGGGSGFDPFSSLELASLLNALAPELPVFDLPPRPPASGSPGPNEGAPAPPRGLPPGLPPGQFDLTGFIAQTGWNPYSIDLSQYMDQVGYQALSPWDISGFIQHTGSRSLFSGIDWTDFAQTLADSPMGPSSVMNSFTSIMNSSSSAASSFSSVMNSFTSTLTSFTAAGSSFTSVVGSFGLAGAVYPVTGAGNPVATNMSDLQQWMLETGRKPMTVAILNGEGYVDTWGYQDDYAEWKAQKYGSMQQGVAAEPENIIGDEALDFVFWNESSYIDFVNSEDYVMYGDSGYELWRARLVAEMIEGERRRQTIIDEQRQKLAEREFDEFLADFSHFEKEWRQAEREALFDRFLSDLTAFDKEWNKGNVKKGTIPMSPEEREAYFAKLLTEHIKRTDPDFFSDIEERGGVDENGVLRRDEYFQYGDQSSRGGLSERPLIDRLADKYGEDVKYNRHLLELEWHNITDEQKRANPWLVQAKIDWYTETFPDKTPRQREQFIRGLLGDSFDNADPGALATWAEVLTDPRGLSDQTVSVGTRVVGDIQALGQFLDDHLVTGFDVSEAFRSQEGRDRLWQKIQNEVALAKGVHNIGVEFANFFLFDNDSIRERVFDAIEGRIDYLSDHPDELAETVSLAIAGEALTHAGILKYVKYLDETRAAKLAAIEKQMTDLYGDGVKVGGGGYGEVTFKGEHGNVVKVITKADGPEGMEHAMRQVAGYDLIKNNPDIPTVDIYDVGMNQGKAVMKI